MLQRTLNFIFFLTLSVLLMSDLMAKDPNDMEGSQDPPVFSRMPGFYIYDYREMEFDRFEFPVGPDKVETIEGRYFYLNYYANEGITLPSGLQITRNYVNAAKVIGGQEVYELDDGGTLYVTLKVVQGDAEFWTQVQAASNGMYQLYMIRRQLMKQDVTADAESLAGDINQTGKAAVYGIYFDTGKSELKAESEPALQEIARLLKTDSRLKLFVVGHTDNVGAFDFNIKLSRDRAAAVVNALVGTHGIDSARLLPYGDGPTAPVASNQTEEGRAKNRRVELVAQ